ncbi:MAG: PIN domain-containing protein [Oscillospiraceae bacterium]|nr:PIN domain-containing protein [Oscillospiraceae bacterium]
MKVWIDTNVIIDVLEERKGFADISWKVWELCRTTKIIGYISALSVPNIVYIMRKELNPKKTRDLVDNLSLLFDISELSRRDIIFAANMMTHDLEDAIQMVQAERCGAEYIVTRNIKDFAGSAVRAVTPDEFIGIYESET